MLRNTALVVPSESAGAGKQAPRAKDFDGTALEWVTTGDDTLIACCSLPAAPYYGMHRCLHFDCETVGGSWARFYWMNIIAG